MICSFALGRFAYQPKTVLPLAQTELPCQQTARFVPSTSLLAGFGVRFCACRFEAVTVYGEGSPVPIVVAGRLKYVEVGDSAFHSVMFQSQTPYMDWVPLANCSGPRLVSWVRWPVPNSTSRRGALLVAVVEITSNCVVIGCPDCVVK